MSAWGPAGAAGDPALLYVPVPCHRAHVEYAANADVEKRHEMLVPKVARGSATG